MFVLLGVFFVLLILKTPVAFSLFASSIAYFVVNGTSPVVAVQRIMAGPDSFTLLAVPGFILAGAIMNSGGITTRIFNFANKTVGHITGGLGHANILASVIFAGMSGAAIADAAGLGAIELKAMKDAGYDDDFSLAVTGASSTIGPIIPPSIPAVVFGVASGVSIGRLFIAGVVPGLLMALAMSAYVYYECKRRGFKPGKRATLKEFMIALRDGFFPLLTPVVIVGGILVGVFTPTEAAMIAVVYSIILAFVYKTITVRQLPSFLRETLSTTVSVMFIVASASLFGWILASEQVPQVLAKAFLGSVSNKYIGIILINIFLLIVGCFMETTAALIILTPVLMPVVTMLGFSPVHFGIIMILNLMIGLLTPPVGMVLYVLSTVSGVPFERISKAVFPYIVILITLLFVISFVPVIVEFLPNIIYGVSAN